MKPNSEFELLQRVQHIAGLTLAELAAMLHIPVPANLKRDKGWVGMLIETALGASAGSKPEQDFAELGIELKTIPIDEMGRPLETTFVSLAPLIQNSGISWESSHVKHKLSKVLWVPVQGSRQIPLGQRYIGQGFLWQPSRDQEKRLQQDWEELMDYIVLGQVERINARLGEVLQLRPKGANSQALTKAIGKQGETIETLPLGFYLRKEFTHEILQQFFTSQ